MRDGGGGGYTPEEQDRRERARLEAAACFERNEPTVEVAARFRVPVRRVQKWRQVWREGGVEALRSRGPVSRERLLPARWERLEAELARGPLVHGYADDQPWTLKRIKLLIGRLFHVGYTVQGVWKLLRRQGWSCQVPARRAVERDEAAIEVWKERVWPRVKEPRRTWAPTSASRTRQARP